PGAERQQHRQQCCQRGRPGTRQPKSARLTGLEHLPPGTCGSACERGLLAQLVDALSSSTSEPTSARFSTHLGTRFTVVEAFPEPCDVRHRGPPGLVRDSGADAALAMASSASAAAAKGSARSRSVAISRTIRSRQSVGKRPACWIRWAVFTAHLRRSRCAALHCLRTDKRGWAHRRRYVLWLREGRGRLRGRCG